MHVDIVAQGFDAGIRNRRWIHQDMVTVRLTGPYKNIIVASGSYLAARGAPKSIADLHQHNCIGFHHSSSGAIFDWELIDGNKPVVVKTSGTALVTGPMEAMSLVLAGVGIAYVAEPLACSYLSEGEFFKWLLPKRRSNLMDCFLLSAACVPCAEASHLY
jgi:DNA-binding transcriptional LysR family regulator